MNDIATKPAKARKPNIGSDPTRGSRVKVWQVGFYAVVLGVSVLLIGLSLWYLFTGRFSRVFTFGAVIFTGLAWSLVTTKNQTVEEPDGIKVNNVEPQLQSFVQQVCDQVGAEMPNATYLSTAAEFGITESTEYFGLKIDKRALTIGLPYLRSLTRQELAALLAYELGLYADTGVAHGVPAHRGLRSGRDLIKVERKGFLNGVYGSYARKMFRSVGGVGVAHEEAAAKNAVVLYGTDAMRSGLEKLDDTAVAFDQLLREYVVPALQNQMHPQDMFGGFGEFLASPTRAEERNRTVEKRRAKERNEFDLLLTPAERRIRIDEWPAEQGQVTVERANEAAHHLLDPDAKSSEIAVGSWANKLMTHRTEPQSWDQLVEQVYSAKTQSLASMVFEDTVDADDQLERALAWSENDEWVQVDGSMEACLKSIKDPTARRTKWARCVVVEAAAATGSYEWKLDWDGPPVLVDPTGEPFDAIGIASMIANGNATEARSAFDDAIAAN